LPLKRASAIEETFGAGGTKGLIEKAKWFRLERFDLRRHLKAYPPRKVNEARPATEATA
jgi:hypothetical protein